MVDSHTLTTYGGWAVVAGVAGGYWYLQKRKPAARPSKLVETVAAKAAPIKKDAKQKIKAVEATLSSGAETEKGTKKKNAKKNKNATTKESAPAAAPKSPVAQDSDDEGSEEISNKEFARQLNQAKLGHQVGAKPAASGRQKSVRQSRANGNGFSATDADADDDSESARSNQGGVADMLESPSGGPSSIRITASNNAQPQKEKKQAKTPEPAETKKQRQNRKKREMEQEARAEAEAVRKVEEEKQRRTARLAEGRAAKDGSASIAKAAAAAVWKGPEGPNSAPTNGHIQLLDTTEQPAAPQQKTQTTSASAYSALPSEEEQLRQLQQEDSWQSVPSKKSKAKKSNNQENVKPVAEAPAPVAAAASRYAPARERSQKPDSHKNNTAEVEYRNEHGENETAIYNLTEEVWQV